MPKIASAGLRKGIMGATLAGYGLAEFDDQEQIQIMNLVESGLSEDEAIQQVKGNKLNTLGRALPTLAGEAILGGKMPKAGILGTALLAGSGALQGLETSATRGYDAPRALGEILSGGLQGALPGAIETAVRYKSKQL
jgi:hypothetical protein